MNRRDTVLALLALGAAPFAARAQPVGKIYRVGFLGSEDPARGQAFRKGLRELGYVEGRNLVIEARYDKGNAEGLTALAAELVRLKVDVIFAASSTYVRAAKQATGTIPIVFAAHNDPVGTGDVASLAHPGGNITGLTLMASDLTGKQLQLLREIVPGVTRVAVMWNPTTPSHKPALKQIEAAARVLGVQLSRVEAKNASEIDPAFAAATRERVQAVFLLASPMLAQELARVASSAAKHRLPTMYSFREFVDVGGLIAYGPDVLDLYRRSAGYIDRILKGAKPAELPVEQPTKIELVINRKTAKTLGLTIPQSILVRAAEVIE